MRNFATTIPYNTMKTSIIFILCLTLGLAACVDTDAPGGGANDPDAYVRTFSNRKTVTVDVTSEVPGAYYAFYYGNPYDGETLSRLPVLTGFTPIHTTLDVPADVRNIYVTANGDLKGYPVGNISIAANAAESTRASDTFQVPAEVMTAVNSIYFPEKPNNVRGEDLYVCTDLSISRTPATGDFDEAEVWLTFLGDGGARQGQLYGKLWFYTYPSDRAGHLTLDDCTFFGVENDQVVRVTLDDLRAYRKWVFFTREELTGNISSYKRFKLGSFPKGVNIGFAYYGNSPVGDRGIRFTTPALNPKVEDFTLRYTDGSGSFRITDRRLANGFICHVTAGDFQGNILGMENRLVTETGKYDGDYNDMLCLVQSNPKEIEPEGSVDIGNSGEEDPEKLECKTTSGIYLFEDNYPWQGDLDFNDAVVQYQIKEYYKSSNQAKQVTVRALATGASMDNKFGYRDARGFTCLLSGLSGFHNVYPNRSWEMLGVEAVTQTLYGAIQPCMENGRGVEIYLSSFNTTDYPCVLDIPLGNPEDSTWSFLWPQEGKSIDDCYYFLHNATGGPRDPDWYKTPKNSDLVIQRPE